MNYLVYKDRVFFVHTIVEDERDDVGGRQTACLRAKNYGDCSDTATNAKLPTGKRSDLS